jgi:hypothetical protein
LVGESELSGVSNAKLGDLYAFTRTKIKQFLETWIQLLHFDNNGPSLLRPKTLTSEQPTY